MRSSQGGLRKPTVTGRHYLTGLRVASRDTSHTRDPLSISTVSSFWHAVHCRRLYDFPPSPNVSSSANRSSRHTLQTAKSSNSDCQRSTSARTVGRQISTASTIRLHHRVSLSDLKTWPLC